jgi:hypothetical protein
MSAVFPGRYTVHTEEPFVVFLIGMSINKPLAVRKWLPVLSAMPTMIAELYAHPERGMLANRTYISWPALLLALVRASGSFRTQPERLAFTRMAAV